MTQLPGSYDIVINIQGDEPLMEPHVIDDVVRALQNTPNAVYRCAPPLPQYFSSISLYCSSQRTSTVASQA